MTFPDRKYSDIASFADDYFGQWAAAAASVDGQRLIEAAAILDQCYAGERTLYVCGNGGSAAISDSFVGDHAKLVQTDTTLRPRVVSLAAATTLVTAIANDISYDDIFVYQLQTMAQPGDVLITVSASGDSENIVKAAQWASDNALPVIALTGFSGGRSAAIATVNLHVAADNYGVIEDTHQALMHILAQYIRQSRMSDGLIANRKF